VKIIGESPENMVTVAHVFYTDEGSWCNSDVREEGGIDAIKKLCKIFRSSKNKKQDIEPDIKPDLIIYMNKKKTDYLYE